MAARWTYVGVALAIALLLLTVSLCTCTTVTTPENTSDVLSKEDRSTIYGALEDILRNADNYIKPDRNYYAGRLFTKLIDLDKRAKKSAVIRFTRWTADCSIAISSTQTSKGSDLLDAWKPLLERMRRYLLGVEKGYEWVAVSSHTDWIDYYVIQKSPPPLTQAPSFKSVSDHDHDVRSSVTDCTIQPLMLLSHDSAIPLSQLRPGDALLSPDGKYKLTIPLSSAVMAFCVLNLEEANGKIVWQNDLHAPWPQINCAAALRSDGSLELWNDNKLIWIARTQPCSSSTDCAGAASLAFMDGHVKLYKSVDDHLSVYWSIPN